LEGTFVEGKLLVTYNEEESSLEDVTEAIEDMGGEVEEAKKLEVEGEVETEETVASITVDENTSVAEAVATLEQDDSVVSVQPNFIYWRTATVNDPYANKYTDSSSSVNQWWLSSTYLDANNAWDISKTEGKVTVAVIDDSCNFQHPDMKANVIHEAAWETTSTARKSYITSSTGGKIYGKKFSDQPDSTLYHGSHVAGITAAVANNGYGLAGISYNAKILPIRVFEKYWNSSKQKYEVGADDESIILGMKYLLSTPKGESQTIAKKYNVRVINMSLGGYSRAQDTAYRNIINQCYNAGIVLVAAAANDYITDYSYPASYDNVICVSAHGSDGKWSSYSNRNDKVDICAPGTSIWSMGYGTSGSNLWLNISGTSMATPNVAGVCALLLAYNQNLTPAQVEEALIQSATKSSEMGGKNYTIYHGYGLCDAYAALKYVQNKWGSDGSADSGSGDTGSDEGSKLNGLVKDSDGIYRYYTNGEVDTTKRGIYNVSKKVAVYLVSGVQSTSTTGIGTDSYGCYHYIVNGITNTSYTGTLQTTNGYYYDFVNGWTDTRYLEGEEPTDPIDDDDDEEEAKLNGLVKDSDGLYRYYYEGTVDTTKTGKYETDDNLIVYLAYGVQNTSKACVITTDSRGRYHYVCQGVTNTSYSGTIKASDGYYYIFTNGIGYRSASSGSNCTVTSSGVTLSATYFYYTGYVRRPTVTVKDTCGNTLTYGTDYTLSWYNSYSYYPGTYYVRVNFKGDYANNSSITKYYYITRYYY